MRANKADYPEKMDLPNDLASRRAGILNCEVDFAMEAVAWEFIAASDQICKRDLQSYILGVVRGMSMTLDLTQKALGCLEKQELALLIDRVDHDLDQFTIDIYEQVNAYYDNWSPDGYKKS